MKIKIDSQFFIYIFLVLGSLAVAVLIAKELDLYIEETRFLNHMDKERSDRAESLITADRGIEINVTPPKSRSPSIFSILYIMHLCLGSVAFMTVSINFLSIFLIKTGNASKRIISYYFKFIKISIYFVWIPFAILLIAVTLMK